MSAQERQTIRVRDKRKPGHCWQDNELYDVFQPVIGAIATHVFAAMTRWAFGHRVEMGVREIAEESGVSRSAVQRAVVMMERLSMVRIVPGRGTIPTAYDLLDLKEAAVALGAAWSPHRASYVLTVEAATRIRAQLDAGASVPVGDTSGCGNPLPSVPHRDTSGTLVSQKPGSSVPHRDAHPFIQQDTKLQDHPPLPLPPAGGGRGDDDPIEREANRVADACRFAAKGVRRAIAKQLELALRAEANAGMTPAELADAMLESWASYTADGHLLRFTWGPRRFFAEGFWRTPNLWPIDQELLAQQRRARL